MLRLEKLAFRQPLVWAWDRMVVWRDVLIFTSVTITVAGVVAFVGLRLLKSEDVAGASALPDVMSARCLDPEPREPGP